MNENLDLRQKLEHYFSNTRLDTIQFSNDNSAKRFIFKPAKVILNKTQLKNNL